MGQSITLWFQRSQAISTRASSPRWIRGYAKCQRAGVGQMRRAFRAVVLAVALLRCEGVTASPVEWSVKREMVLGQDLRVHAAPITFIARGAKSKAVLTGSRDGLIRVFYPNDLSPRILRGHASDLATGKTHDIVGISEDPISGDIASASDDGSVRFWRASGDQLSFVQISAEGGAGVPIDAPRCMCRRGAGTESRVAVSLGSRVVELRPGKESLTELFSDKKVAVLALASIPGKDDSLALLCNDGTLRNLVGAEAKVVATLEGPGSSLLSLARLQSASDGRLYAICQWSEGASISTTISELSLKKGVIRTVSRPGVAATDLAVSPNEASLGIATSTGSVDILWSHSLEVAQRIPHAYGERCEWRVEGDVICAGGAGSRLCEFGATTGTEIDPPQSGLRSHPRVVVELPAQSGIVAIDADGNSVQYDLKVGEVLRRRDLGFAGVECAALSGDGTLLAVGGTQGHTTIFDARLLSKQRDIDTPEARQVLLSRDSSHLVVVDWRGGLSCHEVHTGKESGRIDLRGAFDGFRLESAEWMDRDATRLCVVGSRLGSGRCPIVYLSIPALKIVGQTEADISGEQIFSVDDGRSLAVVGSRSSATSMDDDLKAIRIVKSKDGSKVREVEFGDGPWYSARHGRRDIMAIIAQHGKCAVVDLVSGKIRCQWTDEDQDVETDPTWCVWLADGVRLITLNNDATIRVWRVEGL